MKRSSVDHAAMRDMNLALILNTLGEGAPLSRSQLALQTGLNKATVSSIVRELLYGKFVNELGAANGASEVGRPATNLDLNPDAGFMIGAEIGADFISVIITDFAAQMVSRRYESTLRLHGQNAILERFLFLLRESWRQIDRGDRPVFGIGIGVPGLVDVAAGHLLFAPNLGWRDVPLGRLVADEFSAPVYVANEANMAALGESLFGAGRRYTNMLYVSSGIGLGTGIVIDGRLVEGATGFAGEAGHMKLERDGLPCNCGSRGCWETQAGQRALFRRIQDAIEAGESSWLADSDIRRADRLTVPLVVEAAHNGDQVARRALKETGEWLGIGVANLMNVINPELVVFGGPLCPAQQFLLPVIKDFVARHAWKWVVERSEIVLAVHGEDATVMGAVAMVYRNVLRNPRAWLSS